jgi:hypothetical protein
MSDGGLLDLRRAQRFAGSFDASWLEKDERTFLSWLRRLDETRPEGSPSVLVRFSSGRTAPYWVRKAVLVEALDVGELRINARVDDLYDKFTEMSAEIAKLKRRVFGI